MGISSSLSVGFNAKPWESHLRALFVEAPCRIRTVVDIGLFIFIDVVSISRCAATIGPGVNIRRGGWESKVGSLFGPMSKDLLSTPFAGKRRIRNCGGYAIRIGSSSRFSGRRHDGGPQLIRKRYLARSDHSACLLAVYNLLVIHSTFRHLHSIHHYHPKVAVGRREQK